MRGLVRAFVLLLLASGLSAFCVEVAWVRILSGDAEPVVWTSGEPWPARPSGFPFAPSSVLSYATLSPGDSMTEAELERRTWTWGRELDKSGRFSRSSVLVADLGDGSDRRGIVVEAETGAVPVFGGGAAYASVALPLLDDRRTTLGIQGGPNLGSIAYRDEAFGDASLVLDGGIAYANDLLETGGFSGNRLSGSIGIGPRLGPVSDFIVRARAGTPLGDGAGEYGRFVAVEGALELGGFSLSGIEGLDGALIVLGDAYPGSASRKVEAESNLRLELGSATISLAAGAGIAYGALDPSELFDLRSGAVFLRGPEPYPDPVGEFSLARIDVDCTALKLPVTSWFPFSLGPFAFCEAAFVALDADASPSPSGAAGGGLRLKLGPPVGLTIDIGYAFDDRGVGALVVSVLSQNLLTGEDLR